MMDDNELNNQSEDPVSAALAKLAEVIQPVTADPNYYEFIFYLLLLWASFRVYQIEPYAEDTESGGSGVKIISLDNGRKIFDYGYYLCAAPGDDYGSTTTGKLIECAQQMIAILAKRGAKLVGFSGHNIAKRAAWIECVDYNIEVANFYPGDIDWAVRERIKNLRNTQKKTVPAP